MRKYPPATNADKILSTLNPNARSNRRTPLIVVQPDVGFNDPTP